MAISDPRDIPGLVAWYSAEAETGYANDEVMSGWTDLSGNGNHTTAAGAVTGTAPTWQAATGSSGEAAVYFNGGYFNLPPMLAGAAAGEVFATVRDDSSIDRRGHWLRYSPATDTIYYTFGNYVYDNFGRASRNSGPLAAVENWHLIDIHSAPSDYRYRASRLGGSVVTPITTTTNTVNFGTTALTPRLGNSANGAAVNHTDHIFAGWIGAVVLYDRKLTDTERADLDTWLRANPSGGAPTAPLEPSGNLIATAPGVTGSFAGDVVAAPVDAALAGTAPTVTGSFVGELAGAVTGTLAGAAPGVTGDFAAHVATDGATRVNTDSTNRANGLTLVTEWEVTVEPPIAEAPRQPAHDYAVAVSLPNPTLVEGRPT